MQPKISPDAFKELIRTLRCQYVPQPELMVQSSFNSIINNMLQAYPKIPNNEEQLVLNQASAVIEKTRELNWAQYRVSENNLCIALISELLPTEMLDQLSPELTQSLQSLIAACMQDYFYDLALSNTQSRRSRAGREFELMLELLLKSAGIPVQPQSYVGETGKEKAVDLVVPITSHNPAEPTKTVLISAKTTVRERWQEVIEEAQRIQSSKMYLATLDDKITPQTLNLLHDSQIYIVTTASNKAALCGKYWSSAEVSYVLSFEEMLSEIKALIQN